MNIGTASKRTGLPAKTIRYYEEIGLVTPGRRANGYRDYGEAELNKLRFLKGARTLGFSVPDCRQLLSLYEDQGRASAEVKKIAEGHIAELDEKMAALAAMRRTLANLAEACHGDDRPDCPILDEIAGQGPGTRYY